MKPLTLDAVNRAVKSLRVSTRDQFYETAEQPYQFGVRAALDLHSGSEPSLVVAHVLCTICRPLATNPPIGLVIARVNEALHRAGYIDG